MAFLFFLRRILSVIYLMQHPGVPARLKVLPVLAFAYLVFPRDLLLDFRPFGVMDDLVVASILCGIFITKGWQHVERYEKGKNDSIDVDFQVVTRDEERSKNENRDDPSVEPYPRPGRSCAPTSQDSDTGENDTPDKDLRSRE